MATQALGKIVDANVVAVAAAQVVLRNDSLLRFIKEGDDVESPLTVVLQSMNHIMPAINELYQTLL